MRAIGKIKWLIVWVAAIFSYLPPSASAYSSIYLDQNVQLDACDSPYPSLTYHFTLISQYIDHSSPGYNMSIYSDAYLYRDGYLVSLETFETNELYDNTFQGELYIEYYPDKASDWEVLQTVSVNHYLKLVDWYGYWSNEWMDSEGGEFSYSFQTTCVQDVAKPPVNVTVIGNDDATALLSWTPPDNAVDVAHYEIYLNGAYAATVQGGAATSHLLYGLNSGRHHYLSIRSVYNYGDVSSFSSEASFFRPNPPAPMQVLASSTSESEAAISWEPPPTGAENITGYEVYRNGTLLQAVPPATRSYSFSGLGANQLYIFTVKAVYGNGDKSNPSQEGYHYAGNVSYHYSNGRLSHISFPSSLKRLVYTYDNNGNLLSAKMQ